MLWVILSTVFTAAAIVLYQQFKYHLPRKYTIFYSVLYIVLLGIGFSMVDDGLYLKAVATMSFLLASIFGYLIFVSRKFEKDYDKFR